MEEIVMTTPLQIWLNAFRPRTLLLVVAGAMSATAVSLPFGRNYVAMSLVFLTALSLQILSNISNDYGDTVHGADSKDRIGPLRTVQAGLISRTTMRRAIIVASMVSAIFGGLLVIYMYRMIGPLYFTGFLLVGGASIWAAIAYTASKNPYGYIGLGDLMVFVFFGLVMVIGGSWLMASTLVPQSAFVGAGLGFLSAAVLNINNMRDLQNDKAEGKLTVAVRLGDGRARQYHLALIIAALASLTTYTLLTPPSWTSWLWILWSLPLIMHTQKMRKAPPSELDRFLPHLVLLTTAISATQLLAAIVAM